MEEERAKHRAEAAQAASAAAALHSALEVINPKP